MYATVDDFRQEGITEQMASTSRLTALIDEAHRLIDKNTGWFFYPRSMVLALSGRGSPSVETPAPIIQLEQLSIDGQSVSINSGSLFIDGAPVKPGFQSPRLTFKDGRVFPAGVGRILATGIWGYTEDDGTSLGRTPLDIRRACLLLVLRQLPRLADTDAVFEAQNQWRILSEKTRDQSYQLAQEKRTAELTGDPDVDAVLLRYRRPMGLGAV